MLNIIFKKPDLGVISFSLAPNKFGDGKRDILESKCFNLPEVRSLPFLTIEKSKWEDLKNHPLKESREQIYWDGDELKLDIGWHIRLMPTWLIKKKFLDKNAEAIEEEFKNEQLNQQKINNLFFQKTKCEKYSLLDWYKQALDNLNAKPAKEGDKPLIRNKLQIKILELSGK